MKKNRFITGYSGLRALAVIGVILYHLDPNTFIGGYLGVPIFFVLSGYLVTDHMLKSYAQQGSYNNRHFYINRIKKLYPQLITLLWLCSAYIFVFQRNLLAKLNQVVMTNLLSVYNFWQISNGQSYFERFAANESPFTHLWTMSIEGQFYILWPLVIFLLVKFVKKKKNIFWILFGLSIASALEMMVLYLTGADINRIYYGTDTRFFALGLGASLAVIWPVERLRTNISKRDSRLLDLVGLGSFILILMMFCSKAVNPQSAFTYCGGMFIFTVLVTVFAAIIAHPGSHWNQWLTNPLFKWIGSRSYGIYLYQFPVMIFFEDKVTDLADHVMLYHTIGVVLILLLSEVTYRFIERPMGHITFDKVKIYIQKVLNSNEKDYVKRAQVAIFSLIFLLGSIGITVSPSVKAEDFNKSQLAKRIESNGKKQSKDNKKLIAKLKKDKAKQPARSKMVKEAEINAKKHPINKKFEKYGISQVDLQLAKNLQVTAIGDSVMAGSSDDLKKLMPKALIDAAVSRQLNVAFGLIDKYKNEHVLANNILIGLGTNGPFSMDDVDHLMKEVGPKRHVYWINTLVPTRQWQGQVNDLLKQASKKYPNLTVIDWYSYAKKHPNWFYGDKTHPNPVGSKYYSAYIAKVMVKHLK